MIPLRRFCGKEGSLFEKGGVVSLVFLKPTGAKGFKNIEKKEKINSTTCSMIYNRVLAEMPSPLRRGRFDNPPPNVGVCGFEKRTLFF